ncbi:MAG TPA: molybdopterin molybdotransferase MoeA [Steroidobacteraceae bacterium]|nr:molybdopterin molybdotransferase MoeA [Steroidobacteraceae bacterium]
MNTPVPAQVDPAAPGLLVPAQADRLISENLSCLPIESLPLVQCSGAVLRENIYGERDQPPFDRVAMDGIALDSAAARDGRRSFDIQAVQAAGDPPLTLTQPGGCIEAMTGAMLPVGCDLVVPVEDITVKDGIARLKDGISIEAWANVHRRGSDSRQGALLLEAGTRLTPPEVAIAAGAGMARVRVSAQPMLAVVSTGNELVEPGEPVLPHQVRRSNVYGVIAALRRHGFQRVADDHVHDDRAEMRARLKLHLDTHDVLILSGGVSMGRFDLVPSLLTELGVRMVFHRIAQRPGKPLWFGVAPSGPAVFALPGNPVSTLVCLSRYVIPALLAAMGDRTPAARKIPLTAPVTVSSKFVQFVPVRTEVDEWGRDWAVPRLTNGSGDFTALAGTDGFVELPAGPNTYPKGFVTRLFRW